MQPYIDRSFWKYSALRTIEVDRLSWCAKQFHYNSWLLAESVELRYLNRLSHRIEDSACSNRSNRFNRSKKNSVLFRFKWRPGHDHCTFGQKTTLRRIFRTTVPIAKTKVMVRGCFLVKYRQRYEVVGQFNSVHEFLGAALMHVSKILWHKARLVQIQ